MKINKKKSGLMEFTYKQKKRLREGENVLEYPVVEKYTFLGCLFKDKSTIELHMKKVEKKSNYIASKLYSYMKFFTPKLRSNLWSLFIYPLYTMGAYLWITVSKTDKERYIASIR